MPTDKHTDRTLGPPYLLRGDEVLGEQLLQRSVVAAQSLFLKEIAERMGVSE